MPSCQHYVCFCLKKTKGYKVIVLSLPYNPTDKIVSV